MALHGALCMYSITLSYMREMYSKQNKKILYIFFFLGGRRPVVVLGQWIDNEERQGHRHPSPYRPHNPPGCQIWAPIWYFIITTCILYAIWQFQFWKYSILLWKLVFLLFIIWFKSLLSIRLKLSIHCTDILLEETFLHHEIRKKCIVKS